MLFRIIIFSVLFYVAFKIIRIIRRFISVSSQINKTNNAGKGYKKKVYSKDEIEEVDYEEIK